MGDTRDVNEKSGGRLVSEKASASLLSESDEMSIQNPGFMDAIAEQPVPHPETQESPNMSCGQVDEQAPEISNQLSSTIIHDDSHAYKSVGKQCSGAPEQAESEVGAREARVDDRIQAFWSDEPRFARVERIERRSEEHLQHEALAQGCDELPVNEGSYQRLEARLDEANQRLYELQCWAMQQGMTLPASPPTCERPVPLHLGRSDPPSHAGLLSSRSSRIIASTSCASNMDWLESTSDWQDPCYHYGPSSSIPDSSTSPETRFLADQIPSPGLYSQYSTSRASGVQAQQSMSVPYSSLENGFYPNAWSSHPPNFRRTSFPDNIVSGQRYSDPSHWIHEAPLCSKSYGSNTPSHETFHGSRSLNNMQPATDRYRLPPAVGSYPSWLYEDAGSRDPYSQRTQSYAANVKL